MSSVSSGYHASGGAAYERRRPVVDGVAPLRTGDRRALHDTARHDDQTIERYRRPGCETDAPLLQVDGLAADETRTNGAEWRQEIGSQFLWMALVQPRSGRQPKARARPASRTRAERIEARLEEGLATDAERKAVRRWLG
jgi:hypothetical protein